MQNQINVGSYTIHINSMGYTYSQIYVPPVRHNDKGETPPFKFSRELVSLMEGTACIHHRILRLVSGRFVMNHHLYRIYLEDHPRTWIRASQAWLPWLINGGVTHYLPSRMIQVHNFLGTKNHRFHLCR